MIKENAKQISIVKELKTANDQLRASERRLREELIQAVEKSRQIKSEAQRKDVLTRELREKLDCVQDDGSQVRELHAEIDRLKEMTKKLRLEADIKEN